MKDYTKFMKWAIVYFIDRRTQDDGKDKLEVEALFSSVPQAEDNYIIRNEEVKRYILHVDDLEQFETFYNLINDKGLTPFDCWKAEFEGISKSQKEKFLTILS